MMYFWFIPLALLVVLGVSFLFGSRKRTVEGESRLEQAKRMDRE
jgi:hypothetical protein